MTPSGSLAAFPGSETTTPGLAGRSGRNYAPRIFRNEERNAWVGCYFPVSARQAEPISSCEVGPDFRHLPPGYLTTANGRRGPCNASQGPVLLAVAELFVPVRTT